jgi:hypothetical protein
MQFNQQGKKSYKLLTTKNNQNNLEEYTLMYETLGNVALAEPLIVVVVRTVRRPMETRAGDDSMLIQNETHDKITISIDGT